MALTGITTGLCPSCETGNAARASVFGPDLIGDVALLALPLLVVAVASAILHRVV